MSYEIYKSIKQLPDNSFETVSASSNCTNAFGGRDFHTGKIEFFKDNWPYANAEETRALWLIYSAYNGDKFYPSNWKADQRLAYKFMQDNGYDVKDIIVDHNLWLDRAREFIKYKRDSKRNNPKKYYIVQMGGGFIERRTKNRCYQCWYKENAKIFHTSLEELTRMFRGYASYKPTFIEVTKEGEPV